MINQQWPSVFYRRLYALVLGGVLSFTLIISLGWELQPTSAQAGSC